MNTIWPEVFENQGLISTRDPRLLCADGLSAWASCMCGNKPPASFGDVLVQIMERLGMAKAPTAENLSEHAKAKGWLNKQADPRPGE